MLECILRMLFQPRVGGVTYPRVVVINTFGCIYTSGTILSLFPCFVGACPSYFIECGPSHTLDFCVLIRMYRGFPFVYVNVCLSVTKTGLTLPLGDVSKDLVSVGMILFSSIHVAQNPYKLAVNNLKQVLYLRFSQ